MPHPDQHYIYLDHAATTPVDPRVREAMLPFLGEQYGNPSSIHGPGRVVKAAIEHAREQVAALINATPGDIVFTSGGTESDNEAIRLAMELAGAGQNEIITSPAEHHAVLSACMQEGRRGAVTRLLSVTGAAVPDIGELESMIGPRTALCTLMHVNNETGGILPLAETVELLQRHEVLSHCDAVQSGGKLALDVRAVPVDFLSLSAHKIHGPKGVGALYVRKGLRVGQLQFGGGQERGRRGGTENVASIVGFGTAAALAREEMPDRMARWRSLRSEAVAMLNAALPSLHFNGGDEATLPNILSVTLPSEYYDIEGGALLMNCDLAGLAISSGSACAAGSIEPSHVIRAIGREDAETAATVRISFGGHTAAEEMREGIGIFIRVVQEMLARSNPRSHSRITIP